MVTEDRNLSSETSHEIDEKVLFEEDLDAIINLQRRNSTISVNFIEFDENDRTNVRQYIEYCFIHYSQWTTNELEKIRHSTLTSLLDPSFLLTTEEKQWIDKNLGYFRLYFHQAVLPSLISPNKKTINIDDLLNEQRSICVLGDPGSGKTTWTHWLMWKCAQMFWESLEKSIPNVIIPLPIMIPINNLIEYLDQEPSMTFFDCICRVAINNQNEQTSTFIGKYLAYGQTLIILDGLDTIDDKKKRDHLIELLLRFLKSNHFLNESEKVDRTRNRVIITSHLIQSLPEEYFISYKLSPLSSEVLFHFIDNWWNNHCSYLLNGAMDNYVNQWNDRIDQLKSFVERHSTFTELISNIMILSTICQWMTSQILVGTPTKKRIHYYSIGVLVLLIQNKKRSLINQLDYEIFIDLLADIAVHIQEYSSSGLIEKFDLNYKCHACIRTHSTHLSIDNHHCINPYLTSIVDHNSVFFLRYTNNYSFLSLPIQHYFACLFLIRTTDTKQSKIEMTIDRFLFYMANSNFREPLLLGLEWISCQWNYEDLNIFCRLLFTNNNDLFHHILPLGAMLLMTTLPDLKQNPSEKTLQDAFDRFLIVSTNREWLIRFPIFIDYLIDGLNYLPLNIARTWIYDYFQQYSDIEHSRSVFSIFTNLISFLRAIPIWLRNDDHKTHSLSILQSRARIDYIDDNEGNDLFVLDRFLTTISIIDPNLFSSGLVYQSFVKFNIDDQKLSPKCLALLIALYGGLSRFKRIDLDNKDTVVFSSSHMHRDSLEHSWLIDYWNKNQWTHLPDTDDIEKQICTLSSDDDSPESIDLFIIWLCLKGVQQPWIFRKYMSWSAFQHAVLRFRRLALYLSEFYYIKYDFELEMEPTATFREDALSIINQYAQMDKDKNCSIVFHSIAVALARLMIVGGERSLFYSDGSFYPRMLDLDLSDPNLISDLWESSDSQIANFLRLIWKPFLPRDVTLLLEKYDSDSILSIVNKTHPILTFGHKISFLLTLIPRHFQLIFDRFLNLSNLFPFVCLLGEIVRVLSTHEKTSIRFALLLAVLRFHFEKNQWTHIFQGLLVLTNQTKDSNHYFYKFDRFLSDKWDQLPFNEKNLQEEHLKIELFHTRQRAKELLKTSTDSLELYKISIAIAVLTCALYKRDEQPEEIADEIRFIIKNIREPILHLHALSIIWILTQNYATTTIHQMDPVLSEALATIDDQNPVDTHTLLFLIWWTTFSPNADNRTIACQVHCLLDRLFRNIDTDSVEIQQIVCRSLLLALDPYIYPYVRPRICRFIQHSRWLNIIDIFQSESGPLSALIENNSNFIFKNPSTSTLLASMYLMQLSIDIFYLPTWFEIETTSNQRIIFDRTELEKKAIEQLTISSEYRIVSKEAARIITNLLQISQVKSSNYHSLERLLAQCEFVEKAAQSEVIQWLQYKDHPQLSFFAFHAALLITKYSIDAIQLCCQLLDYPVDEFRQRAQKCLSCVCLIASHFTRDQFIRLFTILIRARHTLSILAREILVNIDVRMDSIEYLELLFIWERERIHLLFESPQSSHYLTHNLELQQQDLGISLLEHVNLQSGLLDVLEYLFEYATDRCLQLQNDSETQTIEEQWYFTELVNFIGRDWYISLMDEMSICEQQFTSHLIVLLNNVPLCATLSKAIVSVLLINRSTTPYVPTFTRLEARQCLKKILIDTFEKPSNEHLNDDVLVHVVKHYYHAMNDNDEYILIRLQECLNRNLIVAAADIARIHCRSLKGLKPSLNDFLELVNGEYIRLYHALMSIVVDSRTIFIINSITLDLILKHEDELVPLFIEELSQMQHSNRIRLACALLDRIPIRIHNEIQNRKQLKQTLLRWSQNNKDDRGFYIRFLTSYYNELTIDIKQIFLSAMWDRYQIQLVAYECVINIQRVNSRTIVEDLYSELLSSKSFQQRYISAMLLVQLAKFDQVSVYEVQEKLSEAINQSTVVCGTITHKGKQNLDQALFNLLTQLSFIADPRQEQLNDYHKPNYTNFNRQLEYIIDADQYASFTLPSI